MGNDINELVRQLRGGATINMSPAMLVPNSEILALCDALEAAQKRIEKADIEISQWVSVAEAAGQDDIAWHKLADRDSELICKLADSMLKIIERAEKAEKRVSELEASQPVVPEGWKLVPVEPTPEMRDIWFFMEDFDTEWAAMLNAAPALQESK